MSGSAVMSLPVDLGAGPFSLRTESLVKRYGSVAALSGLDLQVPEGSVYVLVGPNGAGKSTLLRVLMGLVRYDAGMVRVLDREPGAAGADLRAGIGYVPEGHRFGYPWMTVGRLLEQHAVYYPSWDREYARGLVAAYDVDLRRKCHALSKGESRRVQLILALAHRPPLLLLDEPTDGLDHVIRDRTLELLSEHLTDSPTTVLISTHRVYEVERLVDHVGVLSKGRLLGQLPRVELHRNLRRYWADVPEGWSPPSEPGDGVLGRKSGPREVEWTVWGEEERVVADFSRAGATIREVAPLSVDEAVTALLVREERS